jgi:hypothetical protein
MGQNFKEKQKMSCMPYGLAVAIISQKIGNTKNVTQPSGLAVIAMGQKK